MALEAGQFARFGVPCGGTEEMVMAKGQVRSNKEVRKPKKDKTVAKAAPSSPFGSQVKDAGKGGAAKSK